MHSGGSRRRALAWHGGDRRSYSGFVHAKLARMLGASSVLLEAEDFEVAVGVAQWCLRALGCAAEVPMLRDDENEGPCYQQGWAPGLGEAFHAPEGVNSLHWTRFKWPVAVQDLVFGAPGGTKPDIRIGVLVMSRRIPKTVF